jgi:hypothetical protein
VRGRGEPPARVACSDRAHEPRQRSVPGLAERRLTPRSDTRRVAFPTQGRYMRFDGRRAGGLAHDEGTTGENFVFCQGTAIVVTPVPRSMTVRGRWLPERHDVRGSHQGGPARTKDGPLERGCLDGRSGLVRAVYGKARSGLMGGPARCASTKDSVGDDRRSDSRAWIGVLPFPSPGEGLGRARLSRRNLSPPSPRHRVDPNL